MALITGTPLGNIIEQDEVFIEGAPWIYYQRKEATPLNNPDADGFYWGLSGTTQYPVYSLACYEDVALAADMTVNAVRCDKKGDAATIQKLNHLELSLSLSSFFPLSTVAPIIRGSAVTVSGALEKMGIGPINNGIFYRVYLPKVYDEDTGDYLSITLPRAQFTDPWTLAMPSGDKWLLGGISIWGLADETLPSPQQFATIIRADPSLIP